MTPEPTVQYTVKEMLVAMDKRADERHDETQRAVERVNLRIDTIVTDRIVPLERERVRQQGQKVAVNRLGVAAVTLAGIVMSIPSTLYMAGKI